MSSPRTPRAKAAVPRRAKTSPGKRLAARRPAGGQPPILAALPGRRPARGANGPGERWGEAAEGAQTLTERAYLFLEEMIVTLQLPPGSAVSETILSKRLSIGRTPIREALQRLARERLITILPRRGVIVSEINVSSQLRLLEVRREVERLVARCAARRASALERGHFHELAVQFEQAAETGDDLRFMRVDREFNERTLVAARNEFAAGTMRLMQSLSRRYWYQHYQQAADMPVMAALHARVARAIANGEVEAAAAASDALIDNIESFTRATVSTDF